MTIGLASSEFSHGYHRSTEDIDILIPPGIENARLIKKALLVLGDRESENLPDDWFDGEEKIRLSDEVVVDILFKTCGETYESLQKYAETLVVDDIVINTINIEGLLKTKQSDRQKDVMDRHVLEKALALIKKRRSGSDFN